MAMYNIVNCVCDYYTRDTALNSGDAKNNFEN